MTIEVLAMEQRGVDRIGLEPLIGPRGRVSEVLSRKRPLTLNMIRRLNMEWHLPASVLVQTYRLRPGARKKAGGQRKVAHRR